MRLSSAGGRSVVVDGGRETVRLPDGWELTSGLVDLQVNGMGDAFPLADPSSIGRLDEMLARAGVTAWLLAVPSAPADEVIALARAVAAYRADGGSALAGLHLEGPVLSPERPGAHPVEHLRPGTDPDALRLLDLPGVVMVTLAPEVRGAIDYARAAMDRGIVVATGHTDATFEQAREAVDHGITLCTHLFNAMAPVHQRAPGAAIAYLTDERARVAFIGDGAHLHPGIEDLILRVAGDRALMVSDAAPATGVATDRSAPEGVLAGSSATLADAVARIASRHGMARALALAGDAPAAILGRAATLDGGDATIWDERGAVAGCIRGGAVAWAGEGLRALL